MSAARKKCYYNRVRRGCKFHEIDIKYLGVPPKSYLAVELVKDGYVMFSDRSANGKPLNINWERLHNEMTNYGYTGSVK
tara:strand:+ start:1746 stop:1982 length:237 start_codon:yes stop_codon:yes gene_type:complete